MFVDTATVKIVAGRGGDGCLSFRREAFMPRGGPDGGDGGRGGSVILEVTAKIPTLADVARRPVHKAKNGKPGQGRNKTGKSGKDLVLRVPPGTIIRDAETGELIRDLKPEDEGEKIVLVQGGIGGKGNRAFAKATDQAPRTTTTGELGEEKSFVFELKLLADVGLVGLPNAGKSSILKRVSRARPASKNYPFTTLKPSLGVVADEVSQIVWADLPGLIEGAHEGRGLGDEFLKHVERTRIIVHVVDAAASSGKQPLEAYRVIRAELAAYSAELAEKPEVIALNKIDLLEATTEDEDADVEDLQALAFEVGVEDVAGDRGTVPPAALRIATELAKETGRKVFPVSAGTGIGLGALASEAGRLVHEDDERRDEEERRAAREAKEAAKADAAPSEPDPDAPAPDASDAGE